MSIFDKLERKFGFLAIHNLTLYIVVGQVGVYLMALSKGAMVEPFLNEHVRYSFFSFMEGRPWTVVSFLFVPRHLGFSGMDFVWTLLSWFMLYSLGSQLERAWGAFRYNIFILISLSGIILTSLLYPRVYMTNYYLLSSIWFAFFITFPDLPFFFGIKAKWLGIFFAVMTFLEFVAGSGVAKTLIASSLMNVPIFFGRELFLTVRSKKRSIAIRAEKRKLESEPFHTCSICGANDISHPEREFRYRKDGAACSECVPTQQDA